MSPPRPNSTPSEYERLLSYQRILSIVFWSLIAIYIVSFFVPMKSVDVYFAPNAAPAEQGTLYAGYIVLSGAWIPLFFVVPVSLENFLVIYLVFVNFLNPSTGRIAQAWALLLIVAGIAAWTPLLTPKLRHELLVGFYMWAIAVTSLPVCNYLRIRARKREGEKGEREGCNEPESSWPIRSRDKVG